MDFDDNANQIEPKVVVLGQTGVGKTSMIHRYTKGDFNESTQTTIGGAYCKKDVKVGDWMVSLQIWDTAGQERFRSMAPMYYRNAKAAILVYDATDQKTLEMVQGWADELVKHACKDVIFVLAGNKCDVNVSDQSPEVLAKAKKKADELGAKLYHTSAKTGRGIQELFTYIAHRLLVRAKKAGDSRTATDIIDPIQGSQKASCC
mmetsp:Transcript_9195/g.22586  ORF Transcript_9195/g.22586 Transcript_9195/m.22586 type:complete len:204 (+) Transcript_9195:170-781(+)|eukprot:CAMPEP_0114508128 /NCGR_PEP_ID=MMETSP0109-20121206/12415_1 /TAXON_ID=29199 /ORGANISM="Chlorarachnion reptans, Strain CCCM449" /LENGTH=203 /DNA_ID=CAMNT_0001687001 /DNA_START=124 /DNA_END=735 /DNA_ORIENTATION=+